VDHALGRLALVANDHAKAHHVEVVVDQDLEVHSHAVLPYYWIYYDCTFVHHDLDLDPGYRAVDVGRDPDYFVSTAAAVVIVCSCCCYYY
jgi:N-acetyl-beta-hexosaminidase